MTVIVAGHLCVDLTPAFAHEPSLQPGTLVDVGPLGVRLGGAVANTARALRALGVAVTVSAAVGDDALAPIVGEQLLDEGLAHARLHVVEGSATSYSVVVEAPGRDRTFWHHPGANDAFTGADLDLAGASLLHVGYPSLLQSLSRDAGAALVRLFERARAAGVTTSLDLAVVDPAGPAASVDWMLLLDRVLPLTDVASPSADDLRSLAPFVDTAWATAGPGELAEALVALSLIHI